MDSRIGFRIVAIIQLTLCLLCLIGIGDTVQHIIKNEFIELSEAFLSAYMLGAVIWSVVMSMLLIFRAKSSYLLVVLNVVITFFLIIGFIIDASGSKDNVVYLFIIIFIFGTYMLFMIIFLLYKPNKLENIKILNEVSVKFKIYVVGITMLGLIIITASIYIIQEISYRYFSVENYKRKTSVMGNNFNAYRFYDDTLCFNLQNLKSNPWIQYNFNRSIEISAIDIHPGSHSNDELVAENIELVNSNESTTVGDLYTLKSSLTKIKLIFDDNSHQIFKISDLDQIQRIIFNTKKTSSLKIELLDFRKGNKWNDLCLSYLQVLRRVKPFQVKMRVYSKEGDIVKIIKK